MIQKDDHALLVLENERVDHLHVSLLAAELDQVGQVLQALGDHHQGPHGCWGDWVCKIFYIIDFSARF